MKKKDMKVFHGLVNYGTQAGMLAKGLREEGIEAVSVVIEDKSKRLVDIELKSESSKNFIIRKFQFLIFFLKCFSRYNIFHFYFGATFLPFNMDMYLFKLFGKKIVMEYLGHDVDLCLGLNGLNHRGEKMSRLKKVRKVSRQSKWVDKQIVCAPYYYQFVNNSVILPLALDLDMYPYTPMLSNNGTLTIMHCPTHKIYKKTEQIENAISKLKNEGYKINYKCIQNVSHEALKQEFLTADVVIDQLNPWYGTVSIEAMALGRPVISGFHDHLINYDFETFKHLPIINADIRTIYNVLKDVIEGKFDLEKIGRQSREFVERVHSLPVVTKKLLNIYEKL